MNEEKKPFGYSYFLDMYNTATGTADKEINDEDESEEICCE